MECKTTNQRPMTCWGARGYPSYYRVTVRCSLRQINAWLALELSRVELQSEEAEGGKRRARGQKERRGRRQKQRHLESPQPSYSFAFSHFCPLLPNFTRVFPGDSWVKLRSHVSCEEISRFTPRCQAPAESASWLTARAKKTHVFRHHGRRYCCCYCRHERHRRPPPHGRPKSTTRATFLQDAIQCISSAYRSSLRRRLDARRRRIAR